MPYHLAQVNIARMLTTVSEPVMAGLVTRIEEMNRLADNSPGFVWRLPGSAVTAETLRAFEGYFMPSAPERLFYNLSVWEDVDHLRSYVFTTAHAEMLRSRSRWIADFDRAHLALWWIPAGHRPTVAESAARLRDMDERGPSPYAFTFREPFAAPAD